MRSATTGAEAARPAYQQRIPLRFPSARTPRLSPLGDFDTPRGYQGERWRHTGLDLEGEPGDRVIAVAPGEACATRNQIDGLVVHLSPRLATGEEPRDLVFHGAHRGHRLRIGYAHLRGATIPFGQCREVAVGEVLGFIGTSGIATRPHLHFEIVVTEPDVLPGVPGLKGAINPLLLMRRAPGEPLGSITCYQAGMSYRANDGDPPDALAIVWPTETC